MSRNYYDVLGVARNATADQIKKAYRKLAMKYHPDRNLGDTSIKAKFQEIAHAYDILSDDTSRAKYDRFGTDGEKMGSGDGGAAENQGGDFNSIFEEMFKRAGGSNRSSSGESVYRSQNVGEDIYRKITITLEEVLTGVDKTFNYMVNTPCKTCKGKGGENITTCSFCRGTGQQRVSPGFITFTSTCPKCNGQGVLAERICQSCFGQTTQSTKHTITVKIPAGIEDQNSLVLSSKGHYGFSQGRPGALHVIVAIEKHSIFTRNGRDLSRQLPISFMTACIGGNVDVGCLDKVLSMRIKPETQNTSIYKIPGQGLSSVNNSARGDLLCHIHIDVPVNLNEEQRAKLIDFYNSLGHKQHVQKGIFESIGEFIREL
jgi:molecular chaperone DnaJ